MRIVASDLYSGMIATSQVKSTCQTHVNIIFKQLLYAHDEKINRILLSLRISLIDRANSLSCLLSM
jgi:hypothetical protein